MQTVAKAAAGEQGVAGVADRLAEHKNRVTYTDGYSWGILSQRPAIRDTTAATGWPHKMYAGLRFQPRGNFNDDRLVDLD